MIRALILSIILLCAAAQPGIALTKKEANYLRFLQQQKAEKMIKRQKQLDLYGNNGAIQRKAARDAMEKSAQPQKSKAAVKSLPKTAIKKPEPGQNVLAKEKSKYTDQNSEFNNKFNDMLGVVKSGGPAAGNNDSVSTQYKAMKAATGADQF